MRGPVVRRAFAVTAALAAFGAPARGAGMAGSRPAVIGGSAVVGAEYGTIGALVRSTGGGADTVVCTATAVSARAVVTAAHCQSDWPLSFILAGGTHEVTKTWVHPDFDLEDGEHDVAVMALGGPLAADGDVPALFEAKPLTVGTEVELVGYGPTAPGGAAGEEKNAGKAAIEELSDAELVVGKRGDVENCGGDSGGPAFVRDAGELWLVGIASRALDRDAPCAGGAVLTRLGGEREFVEDALNLAERNDAQGGCVVAHPRATKAHWLVATLVLAAAWRGRRARRERRRRSA
jgi:secreted trypsin-like serine protease